MGRRRFVVIAAAAAAALGVWPATASAEPAQDGQDPVKVEANLPDARAARAAVDPVLSEFVPINPTRALDTRTTGSPVGQGLARTVDLSAHTPAEAVAVVLNVTGTEPTAATHVSVYPANEPLPISSNLNLSPGQTRANQVTTALSPDREVNLYNNAGNTHLIVDVAGYYVADLATLYNTINPLRLLDTRTTGSPAGPGGVVDVDMSFLPASVTAVTFNLTAVDATAATFVSAYPSGQPVPVASSLNLGPGQTVPNQVTVRLGTDRHIKLYNNAGSTHLIVDLAGYYSSESGLYFLAISPERAWDTRFPSRPVRANSWVGLVGWGSETAEWAIHGVAGNLTSVNPPANGHVTVWPGGQPRPNASNLNLVPNQIVPNAVNVGIGFEPNPVINARSINFANNSPGDIHLVFDVSGFFIEVNA
jgi:hypothetical protein